MQCQYLEQCGNKSLLKSVNYPPISSAYFQIITQGISPTYYLVALKYKDEVDYTKFRLYVPDANSSVVGKTKSGFYSFDITRFPTCILSVDSLLFNDIGKQEISGAEFFWALGIEKMDYKYIFQFSKVVDMYGYTVDSNTNKNPSVNNHNYNNTSKGRSKVSIQHDLDKAQRLLLDMERNQANDKSPINQMQYNRMIIEQRRKI